MMETIRLKRTLAFWTVLFHSVLSGYAEVKTIRGFHGWSKNTNFGNANNWEGLVDVNCSSNIFSFPEWMETRVVSWPSSFIGKQIILPVNGHLVFQPGVTTLSDQGICQHGREVKFQATSQLNWFDPKNWEVTESHASQGQNAIPDVEKVPCQFDSVRFPSRSTFSLTIPHDVSVGKFFLGEKNLSYTEIAFMMSSEVGKKEFAKNPETSFNLTKIECKDDNFCICENYKSNIRQKVCALVQPTCDTPDENDCYNPILPHGFCCPVCGFHIKIKHLGDLKLVSVWTNLKSWTAEQASTPIDYFTSRYAPNSAHVILIPAKNATAAAIGVLGRTVTLLKSLPQVDDVTWTGSWEVVPSEVDKWTSQGLSGATITFLVVLGATLLIGLLCFIFYRNKGSSTETPSILRFLPSGLSFPSIQIPNVGLRIPGRRGSTQAGGRTFGFARFSNERVSTVNIGGSPSTIERGEVVDDAINRIDSTIEEEKITEVTPDPGFTQVTYDLVGVHEANEKSLQQGIEMVTKSEPIVDATGSGPPKPSRTGEFKTDVQEQVIGEKEPIYTEVYDAVKSDDDVSPILTTMETEDVDEE